jgi:hypothetical protein
MEKWIEEHGTVALKRAFEEGYQVNMGVASHLTDQVEDSLDMGVHSSWDSVEERTSPSSEAFGKRDLVVACVKTLQLPERWSADVSRISRITLLGGVKCTGVMVVVRNDSRTIIRQVAINFEG